MVSKYGSMDSESVLCFHVLDLLELTPVEVFENRKFKDGFHAAAQGTVFMVKLHVVDVRRGRRAVTSVNHLPILLKLEVKR